MHRRTTIALTLAALLLGAAPALAKTVQGVTFPDTATVGGQSVTLNGMGVRVAYIFVKVYVGGLYLATPTHDGTAAVQTDEPKRVLLQFLRDVTHEEMVKAMREGFAHTAAASMQPQVDQFSGFFTQPLVTGSQASFDYVPGTGTTVVIGGQTKGTIPGADFMRALWGIWLGDKPADANLKAGMLGTD